MSADEVMRAAVDPVDILRSTLRTSQQLGQMGEDARPIVIPLTLASDLASMLLKGQAFEVAIRSALAPVMHWYDGESTDGDEHEPRDLVDILTDVVSDLQADRASALRMLAALREIAAFANSRSNDDGQRTFTRPCHPALKHIEGLAQAAVDGADMEDRTDG